MRKIALFTSLLALLLGFSACSLENMDQQEGVIWDVDTEASVTCGIEIKDNNIYFADSFANIYSLWIDTGSMRWKRTLSAETVTGIYPDHNNLVIVSVNSTRTMIRYYSFDEGNIVFQTNLGVIVKDSYLISGSKMILHTASKLVVFNLNDGHTDIYDYSLYLNLNGIRTAVRGTDCYYLVSDQSRIVKVRDDFHTMSVYSDFEGDAFNGSALYLNYNLYLAGPKGIKVLPSMGKPYSSAMSGQISYSPMTAIADPFNTVIYSGLSDSQRYGIGRYSQTISDVAEDWFRQTFAAVTWSPIAYSDTLSVVAVLDDGGMFIVYDAKSGKFIYSKYIGIINKPGLTFKNDYYSKSVFLPVSSPAKIVCYSLNFAVNHRKY